jgi:sorting nexin-1/2
VLRRYSDFLWLYETLSLNNPGVVVPPVPEKNPFGRFEGSFVEQRRHGLEKCINKMANHPVLMKDVDLKMFLESDSFALDVSFGDGLVTERTHLLFSQIKQRKAEIANERGGLMASIGQTITGPRFHETDEVRSLLVFTGSDRLIRIQWFDQKKSYLDSLELQLRGLVKAIDLVTKQRSGTISPEYNNVLINTFC